MEPNIRKSINPGMITGQPCPLISNIRRQVRNLIYTTNAIEGFNRQLRKVTKSKTVFPTDDSLIKNALSGNYGHHKKMDRTQQRLEPDPCTIRYIF